MPTPTGPTNPELRKLIVELEKTRVKEYKEIARILKRPRRSKTSVNLHTLNHVSVKSSNIVVPWKVLGSGDISKPVRVFSFAFSQKAKEKIIEAGGECLELREITKEQPNHVIVLRDITREEE